MSMHITRNFLLIHSSPRSTGVIALFPRWRTVRGAYLLICELRVSLWCAYDTPHCHEQLEEKSDDETKETIHCQWKRSIGWGLTPSPALRRTQCGTKHKKQSGTPRALLDIIVE